MSAVVGAADAAPVPAHRPVVLAADACFGGFCAVMLVLVTAAWLQGRSSWHGVAAIALFLVANVVVSQASIRSRRPMRVEAARAAVGAVVAPLAYFTVDGPFAPWWPGFLIMCAGGCTIVAFV